MFDDAQKVSTVFADKTRFSIYQFIMNHPNTTCTVKEIAQEFSIHPNVARLHLSKLEEIGLLESGWDHQAIPGRPGRVYSLRQKAISMTFPPRDFQLLAELVLEVLGGGGDSSLKSLGDVGYRYGVRLAQGLLASSDDLGFRFSTSSNLRPLEDVLSVEGMSTSIFLDDQERKVIRLRNCPFREAAERYSRLTCHLHRSILRGIWETLFEPVQMRSGACQAKGDRCCEICVLPQDQMEEVGA